MSTYDTVGTVAIRGKKAEPPNSPRLLGLLKPEACGLGGELVVIGASANLTYSGSLHGDDSQHFYMVMRKKSDQDAVKQTF